MPLKRITFSSRFMQEAPSDNYWKTISRGFMLGLLDVTILITVGISIFYLFAGYVVRPYERGLFCNDTSIRGPFLHNTITTKHLLAVSLVMPVLFITIFEGLFYLNSKGINKLAKLYRSISLEYCEYLVIYTLCTILMEFFKCYFGRLRPHFLTACNPDWKKMECSTNPNGYVEKIVCNADEHRVRVSRTSFPSGHAAAACYVTFYFLQYTNRLSSASNYSSIRMARKLLLIPLTTWCLVVMVTRVTDYWHYPTDVLGGFLLGFFCAMVPFGFNRQDDVYSKREIQSSLKDA